jgi:hypothetical protein
VQDDGLENANGVWTCHDPSGKNTPENPCPKGSLHLVGGKWGALDGTGFVYCKDKQNGVSIISISGVTTN